MSEPHKVNGYKRSQPTIKDPNRICTICSETYCAVAPLQKTCSKECRRIKDNKHQQVFKENHPDAMKKYNENRVAKNPNVWKKKTSETRLEIVNKLGSQCCVENCEVTNPYHLHVDYIPTMIGTGFRHPRHKRWMLDNIKDFRLLCANHHYELTITGKIEGSIITQKVKHAK